MARRLPSQPPVLPGFSYVHVLGSGGFADVFLYEQNMPRRQVAVKVMLSEVVNDQVRQMFQAEANLMAQLSDPPVHPHRLPGECLVRRPPVPRDGALLRDRSPSGTAASAIPVPEVLRIAVKIGSAIETAHRAGVLHRDIKPSNILTTAYGHPVLSDFGIAATLTESKREDESVGLSIPWSAPEVLMDETSGTIVERGVGARRHRLLAARRPVAVRDPRRHRTALERPDVADQPREAAADRPRDVPASLESSCSSAACRRAPSTGHRACWSSCANSRRSRPSSACRRPRSRSPWTSGRSAPSPT